MEKKKYIPSTEEIKDYLENHNLDVMVEKDGQIRLRTCPFCGSGDNGKDSKCSGFFISQHTGDFLCYRKEKCGASGTWSKFRIMLLARDAGLLTPDLRCGAEKFDYEKYTDIVHKAKAQDIDVDSYLCNGEGGQEISSTELKEKIKEEKANREYNIGNVADLAGYSLTGKNYNYMVNLRKINPEVCEAYHIVDFSDDYILLPHVDVDGETVIFSKLRLNHTPLNGESKEKSAGGTPHMYGWDNTGHGTDLIITEGQIDCLSIVSAGAWDYGFDVLSVPVGKDNLSFLSQTELRLLANYDKIIVMGDKTGDNITMVDDFERLLPTVNIEVVRDYHDCKDANEILCRHGADVLISSVNDTTDYAPNDVKIVDVDISKKTRKRLFTYGVSDIDQMVNGVEEGTLTLLLSKEGMGKSTIALQLALQAADAGVHSYIYSGEMDNADVVKTLLLQCAGPTGTTLAKDPVTGVYTQGLKFADWLPKMTQYLNRYITIYNPKTNYTPRFGEKIGTEAFSTVNTLLSEIEKKAARGKVKFFIVDNMMSLLTAAGESNDLFTAQGLLAQKLKDIAVRYNVAILLCVHARKSALGQLALTTDDISGSSTVKNLSDVIISLEKYKPEEVKQKGADPKIIYPKCCENILAKPNTQLRILKNRHHSTKHDQGDGCLIWYVPQCKTIYGADVYGPMERDNDKIPPRKWMQEMAKNE